MGPAPSSLGSVHRGPKMMRGRVEVGAVVGAVPVLVAVVVVVGAAAVGVVGVVVAPGGWNGFGKGTPSEAETASPRG